MLKRTQSRPKAYTSTNNIIITINTINIIIIINNNNTNKHGGVVLTGALLRLPGRAM